jgi:hypothetical protein
MTLVGIESNCAALVIALKLIRRSTYAEALEEVLGLLVDVESARLAVLGEVEGGDLGDVLILALTLLFLELEGDTADGTTLDTLHQMCGVSGNLVPETLGSDDGNLFRLVSHMPWRHSELCIFTSSQILLLVSKSSDNLG